MIDESLYLFGLNRFGDLILKVSREFDNDNNIKISCDYHNEHVGYLDYIKTLGWLALL
jgi:hypothetical protein